MKKTLSCLTVFVFLVAFSSVVVFGQEADLIGTWEGSTIIPDVGKNMVTMVVTKEGGELSITISDSIGMLTDIECEDIEFKDGTLTFHFVLVEEFETQTIRITLELGDDTLNGYWENEEGERGEIELEKI